MDKLYCKRDTLNYYENSPKILLTVGKLYHKIRTTCHGDFVVINDNGVKGKYTPDRFDTISEYRERILNQLLTE